MTTAVTSSVAAGYAAPASATSATSAAAGAAPPSPAQSAAAAQPAAGPPALASDTMAALVAQQAEDSSQTPADAAPEYTLPAAVIANMQAFATTDPTQYTDEINSNAAILADDSTASDSDKLHAWVSLTQLLATGSIYNAGNIADLQKAYAAANGS